jgi:hypothetical protein
MSDRELLEMAAKAAEYPVERPDDEDGVFVMRGSSDRTGYIWNPLKDDGDALRLAVKLGINVDTSDGVHVQYIAGGCAYTIGEYEFDDIYACARLLIVGAAAEIGSRMP